MTPAACAWARPSASARTRDERAEQLLAAGADVLVLDSAHGHSVNVLNAIRKVKSSFPNCQLIAGNVATPTKAPAPCSKPAPTASRIGIGPRLHLHHPHRGGRGRASGYGHH